MQDFLLRCCGQLMPAAVLLVQFGSRAVMCVNRPRHAQRSMSSSGRGSTCLPVRNACVATLAGSGASFTIFSPSCLFPDAGSMVRTEVQVVGALAVPCLMILGSLAIWFVRCVGQTRTGEHFSHYFSVAPASLLDVARARVRLLEAPCSSHFKLLATGYWLGCAPHLICATELGVVF